SASGGWFNFAHFGWGSSSSGSSGSAPQVMTPPPGEPLVPFGSCGQLQREATPGMADDLLDLKTAGRMLTIRAAQDQASLLRRLTCDAVSSSPVSSRGGDGKWRVRVGCHEGFNSPDVIKGNIICNTFRDAQMLSVIWGGYTPKPVLPLANAPAEGPSAVLPHHLNVRVTRLGSEVVSRVGAVDPTPKERTNWHEMHILYDSLRSGEKTIWGETLDGKKVNIIFDEPGMAELLMR
ncbi:hypothetical protein FOZ63_013909, partial [Perkinsus olseni]